MARPKLKGKWKKLYKGPYIWVDPQVVEWQRKRKVAAKRAQLAALSQKAKDNAENLGGGKDTKEPEPLVANVSVKSVYDNF